MKWTHDDLQEDLAAHLRASTDRMVWTNMQMGPSGSPRPDVFAVPKSYSRFTPIAYEVKISVSDFRRDVAAGKWQSYLRYASGVTFVVPGGLITKADLPPGCGLMARGDGGWRTVKAPTLRAVENLPLEAWMKLLLDGVGRQTADLKPAYMSEYVLIDRMKQRVGGEVAKLMHDRRSARAEFERATERLEKAADDADRERQRILEEARAHANRQASTIDKARQELAEALGLPADAGLYEITGAAAEARRRLEADAEVQRLRRLLGNVQDALTKAAEPLPAIARAA